MDVAADRIIKDGRALIDQTKARIHHARARIGQSRDIVRRHRGDADHSAMPPLPLGVDRVLQLEVELARQLVVRSTTQIAASRLLIQTAKRLVEYSHEMDPR
jgi:hypothetical protein